MGEREESGRGQLRQGLGGIRMLDFRLVFRGRHWRVGTSLVAQMVKNLPAMQETWAQSLGQEDPLEKGMAIHSSILAWRIPWTESLAGYSPWGLEELDMTE